MANASSTAQHFTACNSYENQAAEFLCKKCPCQPSETRESEHEKTRISRDHDMIFPMADDEDMLILYSVPSIRRRNHKVTVDIVKSQYV